jgi:hypothetical protein
MAAANGSVRVSGSRLRLFQAAAIALGVCVGFAIMEVSLRTWPGLLGQDFVNGVRSKYRTGPGGIFYRDNRLGIHFMIPNYRTEMYYNNYVWTHETDALGFRNRAVSIPADVMLLGDSMIYGHGVEIDSTVGVLLENMTGLRVANLARQGDCAFQQTYLLTEYIGTFRPGHVIYFFFENDISDLNQFLNDAAMRAFVARPLADIRYPPRTDPAVALRERETTLRFWLVRLRDASYSLKAARWLLSRLGVAAVRAAPPTSYLDDPSSLGWQYTRKAIAYMHWLSARHDAELAIVPIVPHHPHYREILSRIAAELGVTYLDTDAFTSADRSLWLPGDGHFSVLGAQRMAALVAAHVGR